jgi:hypothetical protein
MKQLMIIHEKTTMNRMSIGRLRSGRFGRAAGFRDDDFVVCSTSGEADIAPA